MSHESEILRLEDELIAERREFAAENRARIAAEREIERWREWAERAKAAIQRGIDAKARQRAEVARYREAYAHTGNIVLAADETIERLAKAMYREAPCEGRPNWYVEHTFEGEPAVLDDDRCFTGADGVSCPWNRGDRCEVSKLEHLNPDECPLCGRSDPHVHEVL
jgi:hypothetical protein